MARVIKLTKDFSLPLDVVTQTITILAKRRVGKSYTMRKVVEGLLKVDQQVVMIDPKGDQWGIRSSADGKKPGYPVLILGGEHGDLPLEKNAGELVAKLVVEERVNMLLDVSHFSKSDLAVFMAIFLETLYRLKAQEKYRTPMMLVVDEADAIAPQKPQANEARMLGAIDDIVRRGGQRGIGCLLITQRSAVLNKNVLTQSQMLIVLRLIAPQDIAAMKAWIDVHGTEEQRKELLSSVPALPVGDAYFWSPGWPTDEGIFHRGHVLPIETFDSAATPKPGQKRIIPKNLADVNLKTLEKQMAATIEKAKGEDPKLLKKRIFDLEEELKKKVAPAGPMGVSQWMEYGHKYKYAEFFEKQIAARFEETIGKMRFALTNASSTLRKIAELTSRPDVLELTQKDFKLPKDFKPGQTIKYEIPKSAQLTKKDVDMGKIGELGGHSVIVSKTFPPAQPNGIDLEPGKMGKGETSILTAAAQLTDGATRPQLTVLTGYKKTTRNRYIQTLQGLGYVELEGDRVKASPDGLAALGPDYEPLPTGPDLQEYLMRTLPKGEMEILKVLLAHAPNSVEREILTEATGYQKTTRNRYLQSLAARELVEYEGTSVYCSKNLL